jgi:hypothetical protein
MNTKKKETKNKQVDEFNRFRVGQMVLVNPLMLDGFSDWEIGKVSTKCGDDKTLILGVTLNKNNEEIIVNSRFVKAYEKE